MYGSSKYAFPGTEQVPGVASRTEHHPGMTLREYYAGIAMQSMLNNAMGTVSPEEMATRSLRYADALIAALDEDKYR
jgi:hypothetical protein